MDVSPLKNFDERKITRGIKTIKCQLEIQNANVKYVYAYIYLDSPNLGRFFLIIFP